MYKKNIQSTACLCATVDTEEESRILFCILFIRFVN
jgi:hypothetical protein